MSYKGDVRRFRAIIPVDLSVLAVVFLALWFIGNEVYFPDDYDDGVYLASARALASGYSLYSDVFFAQTPLSIAFLPFGLQWINPGETGVRVVILGYSLLSLIGIGLIGQRLFGCRGAILAVALLALQLSRFGALWTCQAEVPAMGCALMAVGLAVTPFRNQRFTMVAAGAFFAWGMLCKVWVLPFVSAILLSPLVMARGDADARLSIGRWLGMLACVAGGACAATAFCLGFYELGALYEQAIQFHLDARKSFELEPGRNAGVLAEYFSRFGGIASLALAGLYLSAVRRRVTLWIGTWFAAGLGFLFVHTPLFEHHALLLAPPLTLWGVAAVEELIEFTGRRWARAAIVAATFGVAMFNAGPVKGFPMELIANADRARREERMKPLIGTIQELSAASDLVASDDQGLLFRAGRSCPPDLCDTSFVRIESGYLSEAAAIHSAKDCKLIVLGTGRLRRLPGFMEWLENQFEPVAQFGNTVVYGRTNAAP